MRFFFLSLALSLGLSSCGQKYKYPGSLEIKSYKIGEKVDTSLFKKYENNYFPNYLDGWTMDNIEGLPKKYKDLPIAIWVSRKDSSIALTLLNDIILNITVSYMKQPEQETMCRMAIGKFGADGEKKSYEEPHPLQAWITYWDLKTWETNDVIFQIGNSNMRMPEDPAPTNIRWNLAYSDFLLENKIIADFKKK